VARQLWGAGARVAYCDPHVTEWFVDGRRVEAGGRVADAAAAADLVILLQAHSAYDPAEIGRRAKLLLDTRGVTTAGERL
jgi:UDP-N-acetyl-D-mannosaminuronate dehydrogenase